MGFRRDIIWVKIIISGEREESSLRAPHNLRSGEKKEDIVCLKLKRSNQVSRFARHIVPLVNCMDFEYGLIINYS